MHANNRQYIAVEGSEREWERGAEVKAVKGNIMEVESIKEVRRLPPQVVIPQRVALPQRRLLASGGGMDSKRCPSPALSAVTTHEDYFREMEAAMLSENLNLK